MNASIEKILKYRASPGTKVCLIVLSEFSKPVSTAELNAVTNSHKTFENYMTLFRDEIHRGIVKVVEQRNANGYIRKHFSIDVDILDSFTEE